MRTGNCGVGLSSEEKIEREKESESRDGFVSGHHLRG